MESLAEAGLVEYQFTATTMGYKYGEKVWAKPSEWFDKMVSNGYLILVGVDDGDEPAESGDRADVGSSESSDADSGQGAGGSEEELPS